MFKKMKKILCIALGIALMIPTNVYADEEKITSWEYEYKNSVQEFKVPYTGKYTIECHGAAGGSNSTVPGGKGGFVSADFYITQDTTLYIVTGGKGTYNATRAEGGYNGGGAAYYGAGSGGGATHVALSSGVLSSVPEKNVLIVAGGGGGLSNGGRGYYNASAGDGGGSVGGSAISESYILGYSGQTYGYEYGKGGDASSEYSMFGNYKYYSGGGGGGWYGGLVVDETNMGYVGYQMGGSGGSGYIKESYNGYSYDNTNSATAQNTGNGYVKITYHDIAKSKLILDLGDYGTYNGSSGIVTLEDEIGTEFNVPTPEVIDGYTFTGWEVVSGIYENNNYVYEYKDGYLKAIYEKNDKNISMQKNDNKTNIYYNQYISNIPNAKYFNVLMSINNKGYKVIGSNKTQITDEQFLDIVNEGLCETRIENSGIYGFRLAGAQGGSVDSANGMTGGYGAYEYGEFYIQNGTRVVLESGEKGNIGNYIISGGGGTGFEQDVNGTTCRSATGGGGTFAKIGGTGIEHIKLVAGGGGGSGSQYDNTNIGTWGMPGGAGGVLRNDEKNNNEYGAPYNEKIYGQSAYKLGGAGGGGYYGGTAHVTGINGRGLGGTSYADAAVINNDYQNGNEIMNVDAYAHMFPILYCNTDTFITDINTPDINKPDMPSNLTKQKDHNGININWDIPLDKGTLYQFKIQSYDAGTATSSVNLLEQSEINSVMNTSGIKGYYYHIDTNKISTVNSNGTFTKGNHILVGFSNEKRYLHVAAVDNAGNISETNHIEIPLVEKYDYLELTSDAPDKAVPDRPADHEPYVARVNNYLINWAEPNDYGTTYFQKVFSYDAETDEQLLTSNTTETLIKTGVKGYHYILDEKEFTMVTKNNSIFTSFPKVEVPFETDNDELEFKLIRYLHVATVDVAGNLSPTTTYKIYYQPESIINFVSIYGDWYRNTYENSSIVSLKGKYADVIDMPIPKLDYEYTVTFDLNEYGNLKNSAEIVKVYKRFDGYVKSSPFYGILHTNETFTYTDGKTIELPSKYTFTGPDNASSTLTSHYKNATITLPNVITDDQHLFLGWYSVKYDLHEQDIHLETFVGNAGDTIVIDKNTVLYAKYARLELQSRPHPTFDQNKGVIYLYWNENDEFDKVYKIWQSEDGGVTYYHPETYNPTQQELDQISGN